MKRILLFVLTNLAIMVTLSIVLSLLGIGGYYTPTGIDYTALMVFCAFWGMGGAFISLLISRWMAKRAMGVQLVDGRTGNDDLDWLHSTVRQLADKAGLPMPEVGFYNSPRSTRSPPARARARALSRCRRASCARCAATKSPACSRTRCPTSRTATWSP